MKKFSQKRLNNEKGLTLVELLAVIVILGIIAAIAIPSIGGIIQGTREKAVIADAQNVLAAANLYFLENGTADNDTVVITSTDDKVTSDLIPDYLDDLGSLKTATVTKIAKGNTILFSGKAGSKTVETKTGMTKNELNKLDKAGLEKLVTE